MKFTANLVSASSESESVRVTLPKKIAKMIDLDSQVLLLRIRNRIFPSRIYVSKYGYANISIPIKIARKLNLKVGSKANLEVISWYRFQNFQKNKVKIVQIRGRKYIDRLYSMPNFTVKGRKLVKIPFENDLILCPLSRKAEFVTISRYMPVNKIVKDCYGRKLTTLEQLFETFGLYIGEGDKGFKFGITNFQPFIINYFVNFLETFYKIEKNHWKGNIIYRGNKFNRIIEEKLKEHWRNATDIVNLQKTDFDKIKGKKPAAPYGSLHIRSTLDINRVIYDEWKILFSHFLKVSKYCISVLRGIFAGEGWPELSRHGSLVSVFISSVDKDNQSLYKKLLDKIRININFNKRYARISGWKNFCILAKNEIFLLNPYTNKLFLDGFIKHKKTRDTLRYVLPFREKHKELVVKDILKILNLSKKSARKCRFILNKLVEEGFLIKKGKGNVKDPFRYKIGKKGLEFIQLIERLKTYIQVSRRLLSS